MITSKKLRNRNPEKGPGKWWKSLFDPWWWILASAQPTNPHVWPASAHIFWQNCKMLKRKKIPNWKIFDSQWWILAATICLTNLGSWSKSKTDRGELLDGLKDLFWLMMAKNTFFFFRSSHNFYIKPLIGILKQPVSYFLPLICQITLFISWVIIRRAEVQRHRANYLRTKF